MFLYCCLQLTTLVAGNVLLHLLALSPSWVSILLHFIDRMSNMSMSDMPYKVCPFPGTSKKLHILSLLLCSTFTLHIHNGFIVMSMDTSHSV